MTNTIKQPPNVLFLSSSNSTCKIFSKTTREIGGEIIMVPKLQGKQRYVREKTKCNAIKPEML